MFRQFVRSLAPLAALGLAAVATGCSHGETRVNGEKGVPLDELDMGGKAPREVVLLGPDTVRITDGETLVIHVEGDSEARAALRFTLSDGALGIMRRSGQAGSGTATVLITMPPPRKLVLAGSGTIHAAALAGKRAGVTIAGSGEVAAPAIEVEALAVDIAGSGRFEGAGTAQSLKLVIAGAGDADMTSLRIDEARIEIAGSGSAGFRSDGTVRGTMVGSGTVRVLGRATCTVSGVGSGKLICEPAPGDE